jgi:DNA-binding MarR family transcriptional regulator
VTGLVDALVAPWSRDRDPHPPDRRARLVTLTARGDVLVARLRRDHRALARALFASTARRELDAFASGLA